MDAARFVRSAYMDIDTANEAVNQFKTMLDERINEIAKFCNPKGLNYEKMLCSMYVLATNIEGIYESEIRADTKRKNTEYDKMPLQSIEQIYATIDSNIPTKYTYNSKTTVFMMDSITKSTKVFSLTENECKKVNDIHSFCRGSILYDIYKDKN